MMGFFIFGAPLGALVLVTVSPAMAKVTYPVAVPMECVELAQREGVPLVIQNKYDAAKAKIKLARLSGRDPMVQLCRDAVEVARKAALKYD